MAGFCSLEISGFRHRIGPGGRHGRAGNPDNECHRTEPIGDSRSLVGVAADEGASGRATGLEPATCRATVAGFRVDGRQGLVSKKRGRPSNRKLPAALRERALVLVQSRYADFGPTLAAENPTFQNWVDKEKGGLNCLSAELHLVRIARQGLGRGCAFPGLFRPCQVLLVAWIRAVGSSLGSSWLRSGQISAELGARSPETHLILPSLARPLCSPSTARRLPVVDCRWA